MPCTCHDLATMQSWHVPSICTSSSALQVAMRKSNTLPLLTLCAGFRALLLQQFHVLHGVPGWA
eukprot:scaffold177408_cov24-Tisochrysis_lutea.AAC.1